MENNYNIREDYIIPEGLEFHEEYLKDALALYSRSKKLIWWRKFFIVTTSCVVVGSTALFFIWNRNNEMTDEKAANKQTVQQQNSTPTASGVATETAAVEQNEKISDKVSETNEDLGLQADLNTEVGTLTHSVAKKNLSEMKSKEGEKQSEKTFDHGSPARSGTGLPDQRSSLKSATQSEANDVANGNSEMSVNNSAEQFDEAPQQAAPVERDPLKTSEVEIKMDITTEDATLKEPQVFSFMQNSRLNLQTKEPTLGSVKKLPEPKWSNWKPWLSVGSNLFNSYGTSRYHFQADPRAALGIDYKLHKGWSVGLSAHYYSISGLRLYKTVQQLYYGQDLIVVTNTYLTNKLYYAGIHPEVRKTLNQKHILSAGYDLSYMITGKNMVSSTTDIEGILHPATGYVKGFRDFTHAATFSYDYQFGKNKSVGIFYNLGLTDITRNEYFTGGIYNRNSLLGVNYKMFLK